MDKRKFVEFLDAVRVDARAFYNYKLSKPYKDIIDEICDDIKKFRFYTFDGRFEELFIKLAKDKKYDTLGYDYFLKDIEEGLKKLVVPSIIMLPLNFLDSKIIKNDLTLNENMRLFLPTAGDLEKHTSNELLLIQEKRKSQQFDEPICKYVDGILDGYFDKEHILLAKDRYFFKYPILTIYIEDIDVSVEAEAKFITEAGYSILRMIDYKCSNSEYGRGAWQEAKFPLASSYTVYYNADDQYYADRSSYYGYSFGFNFANFLDISSTCFLNCKDWFSKAVNAFVKAHFIDKRKLSNEELDIVNKWCNSILLYNTAYELASIEKYDACSLILCALMESIFIKNKGRNKSELLANELSEYLRDIYSKKKIENFVQIVKTIYKYRNKIIHEGIGLEKQFICSRSINEYQGAYRGMKPFHYNGSFYPDNDLLGINTIFETLVEILIGDKMLAKVTALIKKAS